MTAQKMNSIDTKGHKDGSLPFLTHSPGSIAERELWSPVSCALPERDILSIDKHTT